MRDLILYSSFKCVRKFKFCVSPIVKRYPGRSLNDYLIKYNTDRRAFVTCRSYICHTI